MRYGLNAVHEVRKQYPRDHLYNDSIRSFFSSTIRQHISPIDLSIPLLLSSHLPPNYYSNMYFTTAFAAVAVMSSSMLVSGAPAEISSQIAILFPTGAQAVTAAPPVPTFGTVSSVQADVADAALGDSNVVNLCPFDVYLYSCNQEGCGAEVTVAANTGTWSAPISSTTDDGVSIKIGTTSGEVEKPILQLEYTNSNGLVYFDASQINGNPFSAYGYTLGDNVGLQDYCAPPCTACPGVYYSGEDGTVYAISNTDSIGFTLCADSSG